jgi:hypothetical protein
VRVQKTCSANSPPPPSPVDLEYSQMFYTLLCGFADDRGGGTRAVGGQSTRAGHAGSRRAVDRGGHTGSRRVVDRGGHAGTAVGGQGRPGRTRAVGGINEVPSTAMRQPQRRARRIVARRLISMHCSRPSVVALLDEGHLRERDRLLLLAQRHVQLGARLVVLGLRKSHTARARIESSIWEPHTARARMDDDICTRADGRSCMCKRIVCTSAAACARAARSLRRETRYSIEVG